MCAEPEPRTDTPPSRRRFWLLVVGIPLLLIGLAAVGWIVSASGSLQSATAEADAQDPNWRLDDLEKARFTPPPGFNAADRVVAVAKLILSQPQPRSWLDPKQDELLQGLYPPALLNDQQVAALRAILQAAGPEGLAEARTLIETPHGRHTIVYSPNFIGTLLPQIQSHREVVALLRYDVLDRLQTGDLDGALAAGHAAFHAGSSIGDEPFLISQLVRIAVQAVAVNTLERVLAQGEPPAERLAALQARIEAEEPAPLLLYGLRGERAGNYMLFENMRNGSVPVTGFMASIGGGGGGFDPLQLLMHLPSFVTAQQAGHLRYMTEMAAIAQKPPEEWDALLAPQRANVPNLPMMVRLLAPAMDKVAQACQRNHANLRNAIVALAAERFRQQHGRWPANAEELVQAKLLKTVPTDPYDGKPIKLIRTADGLIVYCIGPDHTDNGGAIDRQNAIRAGADVGFQLWDPAARRTPAPPPKPLEPPDGGGPPP